MLKINIKYNNYNGEERETDAYFNLNKMEMKRMAAKYPAGIQAHVDRMIATDDSNGMMEMIEYLIKTAYGVRSEDGGSFRKNNEDLELFISSGAYDEYVFGLTENPDDFVKFLMAIFPKDAADAMRAEIERQELLAAEKAKEEEPKEVYVEDN